MMSSPRISSDAESFGPKARSSPGQSGFSLLEVSVVLCIAVVVSSTLFMTLTPAMRSIRATNAFNTTLATLRRAHDQAVAQKGILLVTFTAPGTITVTQATTAACGANSVDNTTWFRTLTSQLPNDVAFTANTLPNPGPDGFGTGKTAIDFDQGITSGGTTIYFCPDGSARDANNNVNNGVVYMQHTSGDVYTSRAITLWGTTSRLRGWRLDKTTSGTYWRRQ
jgi:prepilin-type N-terminal cleavage/methylation domain-containing protein